jgi:4-hydroxybutyrate CoA-transferase
MNWREKYSDKIVSISEALSHISSGDVIGTTMMNSVPYALLDGLYDLKDQLENVWVDMGFATKALRLFLPDSYGRINVKSMFLGPLEREFIKRGSKIATQVIHLSKVPEERSRLNRENVVMMVAAPPDEDGNISLGLCPADAVLVKEAEKVILQINENMPVIKGEGMMIHIDDITCMIDLTEELTEVPTAPPNEIEAQIAGFIVDRVEDGSCIQLGIGGINNAVGSFLKDKKDLGIHTEMFVECMVDLIECGAVNNSKKNLNKGVSIIGFAAGSKRMYDFLNHNDKVESRSFSYVNDPFTVGKIDNFISVNSAMGVDLTGQVSSESIGYRQYSGTGGQVDFVRGAQLSNGGKSFIALPSVLTKKDGTKVSKITLAFEPGTAVTTLRTDVQYIVTEHGIADLKNETIENRAQKLIAIAHPDFRDQLTEDAKKCGLIK